MSISDGNRGALACEVLSKRRKLNWEKIQNKAPVGTIMVTNIDEQDEIIVIAPCGSWHMYLWETPDEHWVCLFSDGGPILVEA